MDPSRAATAGPVSSGSHVGRFVPRSRGVDRAFDDDVYAPPDDHEGRYSTSLGTTHAVAQPLDNLFLTQYGGRAAPSPAAVTAARRHGSRSVDNGPEQRATTQTTAPRVTRVEPQALPRLIGIGGQHALPREARGSAWWARDAESGKVMEMSASAMLDFVTLASDADKAVPGGTHGGTPGQTDVDDAEAAARACFERSAQAAALLAAREMRRGADAQRRQLAMRTALTKRATIASRTSARDAAGVASRERVRASAAAAAAASAAALAAVTEDVRAAAALLASAGSGDASAARSSVLLTSKTGTLALPAAAASLAVASPASFAGFASQISVAASAPGAPEATSLRRADGAVVRVDYGNLARPERAVKSNLRWRVESEPAPARDEREYVFEDDGRGGRRLRRRRRRATRRRTTRTSGRSVTQQGGVSGDASDETSEDERAGGTSPRSAARALGEAAREREFLRLMGRWAGSSEGAVEDEIARRFKWLAPEAPAPSLASEAPAPSQSPGEDGALAEAPAPPTASAAAEAPAPARPLAGRDAGRGDGPDDAWDDEEDEDEREHHRRRSQEEADEAIAKAGGPRRSPHQSPAAVRTRATLMSPSSGSQHALLDLLAYQHGHDGDGAVGSGGEPAASGDDAALPFELPVPDPIYFCGRCAAWLPEREFPPAQLARPARDRRCGACEVIALGELSAAVYIDVHENLAAMAIPPDTLPLPKRPGSSAPAGRVKFEKSEKRRA